MSNAAVLEDTRKESGWISSRKSPTAPTEFTPVDELECVDEPQVAAAKPSETLSGDLDMLLLSLSSRRDMISKEVHTPEVDQEALRDLIDHIRISDAGSSSDVSTLIQGARDLLGSRLLAYIAGLTDTSTLDVWQTQKESPAAEVQTRIRIAQRAARMITSADGRAVAQAWFQGMNPLLEDRAPARVLREESPEDARDRVFAAATAFLAE